MGPTALCLPGFMEKKRPGNAIPDSSGWALRERPVVARFEKSHWEPKGACRWAGGVMCVVGGTFTHQSSKVGKNTTPLVLITDAALITGQKEK